MPPITKPPGRQTNNSLSSIPESLLLASCANKAKKGSASKKEREKEKEKVAVAVDGKSGGGSGGTGQSGGSCKSTGGGTTPPASSSSVGSGGGTGTGTDEKKQNAAASRKKKDKSQVFTPSVIPTLSFTETDEVLQIGMHKVLEYVKNHKDAWPFMDPVEEDIAPRYYSIIRRPMDLLKMEEKLESDEYLRYSDFRNDFKLIVNNCRLYNGHNNEYTEMVNSLQEAFDKATKKYFEQNSSDEEEMNQEYPDLSLKTSAFREKPPGIPTAATVPINTKGGQSPKRKDSGGSVGGAGVKSKSKSTTAEGGEKVKKKKTFEVPKPTSDNAKTVQDASDEEDEEDVESVSKNKKRKGSKATSGSGKKKDNNNSRSNNSAAEESLKDNSAGSVKKTNKHKNKKGSGDVSKKVAEDHRSDGKQGLVEDEEEEEDVVEEEVTAVEEEGRVKGVKRKRRDKEKKRKKKKREAALDEESGPEDLPQRAEESGAEVEPEEELTTTTSTNKKQKHKKTNSESSSHKKGKDKDKSSKKGKHNKEESGKGKSVKHHHHRKDESATLDDEDEEGPRTSSASKSKSTNTASHPKGKHKSKAQVDADQYSFTDDDEPIHAKKQHQEDEEVDSAAESEDRERVTPSPTKKSKKSHADDQKPGKSKGNRETPSDNSKVNKKGQAIDRKSSSKGKDKEKSKVSSGSSKKSAKSASKLSETKSSVKKGRKHNATASDRMSVSSHEDDEKDDRLSRSSTPAFDHSGTRDLDDTFDSLHSSENRTMSRPITPDIKDKYDLIKERRRNAGKSSAVESVSSNSMDRTKNRGKEKKSKQRTRDERSSDRGEEDEEEEDEEANDRDTASMLFDRLREEDLKSSTKGTPEKSSKKKKDEFDFPDESGAGTKGKLNSTNSGGKTMAPTKELKGKKGQMKEPLPKGAKGAAAVPGTGAKKTNMEALELETEQTLKDINRWLEHTPRFPDYNSASNSPSRYMMEEFDAVDPNVFRRPAAAAGANPVAASPSNRTPPVNEATSHGGKKAKEGPPQRPGSGPPGLMAAPTGVPSGAGPRKEVVKDKRKSLKDKIYNRKKEPSRTIDRLQPGKAKGNLLSSIQNINKPDELFALGNMAKLKEVKNSLVVKEDESGPKLSLGSVLDTDRFGLLQQHNFTEDKENDDKSLVEDANSPVAIPNESSSPIEQAKVSADPQLPSAKPEKDSVSKSAATGEEKSEKATPNHSAWFKAFGAPKVSKPDEESRKSEDKLELGSKSPGNKDTDSFYTTSVAPRMRKASTGSTISERSSYSQDPDSPRVGIDERGGYGANPYTTSPLESSPTSLTSPKPDDMTKANYNLNGAIKVGFYQDTTQKSSPEKSCSPREMPTPTYPQYSQPVYSATHAYANYYNTTSPVGGTSTAAPSNGTNAEHNNNNNSKSATTAAVNPQPFYDHYNKQPRSQESDYNSSMSPNPNSPYQQQHNSPYHQQQHSPYQQHHSPAPITQPQSVPNLQPTSPYSQSNQSSPFSQQDPNSPYSRADQMSPYHPNSPSQAPVTISQVAPSANKVAGGWSPANNSTPQTGSSSSQPTMNLPNAAYEAARLQQQLLQQQQQQQPQVTGDAHKIPQAHSNNNNNNSNSSSGGSGTKISPPMAHATAATTSNPAPASVPLPQQLASGGGAQSQQQQQQQQHLTQSHSQYSSMEGQQNIQPAHQNYPMYPPSLTAPATTHSKPYEDPQSLLMSHHAHAHSHHHHYHQQQQQQQGMYSAPNEVPAHGKTESVSQQQQQQQQQQMFDLMRKAPFGNIPNISTSKAFEMFNRAATMAFPKSLSQTTSSGSMGTTTGDPKDLYDMNYSKAGGYVNSTFDMLKGSGQTELLNLGQAKGALDQQQSQQQAAHQQPNTHNAHQSTTTATGQQQQQQQQHQHQQHHQYGTTTRRATDLVIPNPRSVEQQHKPTSIVDQQQQQQQHQVQQHAVATQQRYDYSAMAAYRSQQHLSSMGLDERLMGMPQHQSGYYDKSSLAQNMFAAKQSAMAYGGGYGDTTNSKAGDHHHGHSQATSQMTAAAAAPLVAQPPAPTQTKAKKGGGGRGKKNKTATPPTEPAVAHGNSNSAHNPSHLQANPHAAHGHQMNQTAAHGHHSLDHAHQQSQAQGFQSYSNLKTAIAAASNTTASGGGSSGSAADATAISLKTASMMPASAFNFGPTSTGPLGLYGETSSYLDDFRNPANHYYLPPTPGQATDKGTASGVGGAGVNASAGTANNASNASSSAAAVAAATQSAAAYHQFLSHQQTRPTYPFMNSQLDPNSPIYQQFFQRRQDEIRAQMMLNQGLLGPHPGAPPGAYGQPGYHHPSLSMHKPPYDTMNRPSWL